MINVHKYEGGREIVLEAYYLPSHGGVGIYVTEVDYATKKTRVLQLNDGVNEVAWHDFDLQSGIYIQPTFILGKRSQHTKEFGTLCWEAGLRPESAIESGQHRDALQNHLGDMRALVEKTLKVKLP